MKPFPWSWAARYPGMDDDARRLFEKKVTAIETAGILSKKYKANITKGAVCGRWMRMGLVCGKTERIRRMKASIASFGRKKSQRNTRNTRNTRNNKKTFPEKWLPMLELTIMELRNENCRWPLGPEMAKAERFCGRAEADIIDSRPYCREHAVMARNSRQTWSLKWLLR